MGGGDLSKGSDFAPTGWTCASGYSGTAAPQVCTSAGGAYTVSGCEADCIHPSTAPTGYTKGTMGGDLSKGSDFAPTGWTCASGYSGTIAPQVCTSAGGAYTLQGCEADCIHPSTAPTGYTKEQWVEIYLRALILLQL